MNRSYFSAAALNSMQARLKLVGVEPSSCRFWTAPLGACLLARDGEPTAGLAGRSAAAARYSSGRRIVGATGFAPATARPPAECATRLRHAPKRATGIEPALRAWKAPATT